MLSCSTWIRFEQDTSYSYIFLCIYCTFLIEEKSLKNMKTRSEIRQIGAISEGLWVLVENSKVCMTFNIM